MPQDQPEISENPAFQAAFWRAQRLGWVLSGALIAAALLGLTGSSGAFAEAEWRAGIVTVDYPRVARARASATFQVSAGSRTGSLLIGLNRAFLDGFTIRAMTPAPITASASGAGLALEFAVTGPGPHVVRLDVQTRRSGLLRYEIETPDGPAALSTLSLP